VTPIDAEQAGCPGLVAADNGQDGEQVAALQLVDRQRQSDRRRRAA
jgi:hypothetical protein